MTKSDCLLGQLNKIRERQVGHCSGSCTAALRDQICELDPLPATHLKAVVGVFPSFLTSLFNKSLFSGIQSRLHYFAGKVGYAHRRHPIVQIDI